MASQNPVPSAVKMPLDPMMPVLRQAVEGLAGKFNDVVTVHRAGAARSVVYFGGDVQDLEENMFRHRDHRRYADMYSLERTAMRISDTCQDASVVVVRPVKMARATFACYENFVECVDEVGSPKHRVPSQAEAEEDEDVVRFRALDHLAALLLSLHSLYGLDLDQPKTLVGFSKGVVVLNQMLLELAALGPCLGVDRMCWMDGGHNGGKDTWITDREALRMFARLNVSADVRVTPYQTEDARRPWIGKEEKRFCAELRRAGCSLERELFFEGLPATIDNHFKVITTMAKKPI